MDSRGGGCYKTLARPFLPLRPLLIPLETRPSPVRKADACLPVKSDRMEENLRAALKAETIGLTLAGPHIKACDDIPVPADQWLVRNEI